MKHYIQPMIERKQPQKIVTHVGTNELSTDKILSTIASYITDILHKYHNENMEFLLLKINKRGYGLKKKKDAAKVCLQELCIKKYMVLGT